LYHSYATTIVEREMSAGATLGEDVWDGEIVGENEGVPDMVNVGVIDGEKTLDESGGLRRPTAKPHATVMTTSPNAKQIRRLSEHAGADNRAATRRAAAPMLAKPPAESRRAWSLLALTEVPSEGGAEGAGGEESGPRAGSSGSSKPSSASARGTTASKSRSVMFVAGTSGPSCARQIGHRRETTAATTSA
jgi:hypothetical protein